MSWQPPEYASSPEITSLDPNQESLFHKWISDNKITDLDNPDSHYDYRGYFKEFGNKSVKFGTDHFPDKYKQHGHPTFSVESQYSTGPDDGGTWNGENYIPQKWSPPDFAEVPELKPKEEPSILGTMWKYGNMHPNILGPLAESYSEPAIKYGESGTDLSHKAALYSGEFTNSLGKIADSLINPINVGLAALSGGSSLAAESSFPMAAQLLETPGRLASAGMVGHGVVGVADNTRSPSERLGSIVEGVLGGVGLRSHTTVPNEIPKIEPELDTPKVNLRPPTSVNKKTAFNPGGVVERYIKAVESGEIPKEMPLTEFAKGLKSTWKAPEYAESIPIENKPTATYKGFQSTENPENPAEGFHLYDVNGGPLHGSTVSSETLQQQGIDIPDTPEPEVDLNPELANISSQSNLPNPEAKLKLPKWFDKFMGRKTKAPLTEQNDLIRNPVDSVDRLKNSIAQGLVARKQQDQLYRVERAKRAAQISDVTTPGLKGYYEQLGLLKGELPKIPFESQLTQNDIDSLLDAITNSDLKPYEQINAKAGLIKVVSGVAPQRSEVQHLTNVFGNDIGQLIELHGGLGAIPTAHLVNDVVNLPKSVMATADLSAPLRQGLPLIARGEYWNAFKDMFKYYGDDYAFQANQLALRQRPNYDYGNEVGLFLAGVDEKLAAREEQFLSPLAEKIPLVGSVVKGSERAYVGFLNQLRADTFDSLVKEAQALGHKMYSLELQHGTNKTTKVPSDLGYQIAKFVNTSTGRGNLGRFEKNAVELNAAFFSPRMIASRLTMLNPNYYIKANPFVRKEALKALLSVAAAGMTTAALLRRAGAQVSDDPVSSDFGKARFGDVRVDPYGGFQQYVVAANRLITGRSTSATGRHYNLGQNFVGPSRQSVVMDFARSKESPLASFIDTMLQGDQAFKPSGVGGAARPGMEKSGMSKTQSRVSAEVINRYTPMIIGDLFDIYKSNPDLLPLGILGAFGMGVQTFGAKTSAQMPSDIP